MCRMTNRNSPTKRESREFLMLLPSDFQPNPKDILCGRGNIFANHEGNRFFVKLISDHLEPYEKATTRTEKIRIVDSVLQAIQSNGSRFAKIDNTTKRWYQLCDVQAHEKIGHAIRDNLRKIAKRRRTQQSRAAMREQRREEQPQTMTLDPAVSNSSRRSSSLCPLGEIRQRIQELSNGLPASSESRRQSMGKNSHPALSENRRQSMGKDFHTSLDNDEFLNFINTRWEDSDTEDSTSSSEKAEFMQIESLCMKLNGKRRNSYRVSFSLSNEFPEKNLNFSAGSFFREFGSFTSQ